MSLVILSTVLASTMSGMSPKVYLHTFPPLPHVYSMSPFSLKVESWLRLHGIDYECVHCMEFGPKFVLVGDEVSGSVHTCSGAVCGADVCIDSRKLSFCTAVWILDCAGARALCIHCR